MTDGSIIPQGEAPDGLHISYCEDPVFPGSWFADWRDLQGRVWESGSGTSKDAARMNLLERAGRNASALPAPTLATDVETLSADMADVLDRLDELEERRKTERAMTWFALSQFAEAHPDDEFSRKLRAGEFDGRPRPAQQPGEEAGAAGED